MANTPPRRGLPLLAGLLLALALALPAAPARAAVQWLDRIVAIAGQEVITQRELDAAVQRIAAQLRAQGAELPAPAALRRQVLEKLIVDKLQLQRARRLGIRIDDITLDKAIANIAAENNLSLTQFRRALQKEGVAYPDFREQIRQELTITQLRKREVDQRLHITDQEVDDLIARNKAALQSRRQYHLRHILIAVPEAASPEQVQAAREKAEQVLAQARQGADFAQLAVANSDGQHALEGGDLGWREGDRLPTLFTDTVQHMKPGQVSDLLRSPSGFHIIKLEAVRGGGKGLTVTQRHARHILLKAGDGMTPRMVRNQLEAMRDKIEAGADFGELARRYSQDPGSAKQGGDLGWTASGAFVPEFEEVLQRLQPGQISEPFQTRFGWHIVQLLGRRQGTLSDTELRKRAREFLAAQKREEALQLWLRRLRDEAYVEIRLDDDGRHG